MFIADLEVWNKCRKEFKLLWNKSTLNEVWQNVSFIFADIWKSSHLFMHGAVWSNSINVIEILRCMEISLYNKIYFLLNKIPQAAPCDVNFIASVSFRSKLPFYIHNLCKKKSKKLKVPAFLKICAKVPPDWRLFVILFS